MTQIKPHLADEEISRCLQDAYGLNVEKISFLPIGADFHTAVYRITTSSDTDYFLKLRRGEFFEASVSVPQYLADYGLNQVLPPIETARGQLWTSLASFKAILYPYVEGRNGMEVPLSDKQWIEFGAALKKFHSAPIPKAIANDIERETFSSRWCEKVKIFLRIIEKEIFEEPVAMQMALFLKSKSNEIHHLVRRAEELGCWLQKQPLEHTLCHADIHGGNLLIDKGGALYVVDWDTLLFAPKERDLMFIGSGIGAGILNNWRTPIEEEALFYQGYGSAIINQNAMAYYRFERIIQDIGEYCEQIFLSDEGGEERVQSFEYLKANFLPGGTIERAYHSDKELVKRSL